MKFLLAIFALIFSSGAIHAQTAADSENTKSIPVRHWEFDYFNYGVSAGQGTAYLNFSMALRYNFDTPLVDVGGEFTMGATPHDRYDPLELKKGTTLKRTYFMLLSLTITSVEERMPHFMSEWALDSDLPQNRSLKAALLIPKETSLKN